ncbi:MAG: hypothetical protein II772_09105, partial [Lachnospiraceae bacterium]|nr:hypothetical protein [Lachnospiraceae bacterium]
MRFRSKYTAAAAVAGAIAVLIILVAGTYRMGRAAQRDTETAVRSVSLLYLNELAGRREQVVAANLQQSIANAQIAVGLMDEDDLRDEEHLHAYQARMKQLYGLEKFAFVDQDGLIYTARGEQENIDEYSFDWKTLTKPEISIFDLSSRDKKVVIAVPAGPVRFRDKTFTVCFMEMDMDRLLEGVSMSSSSSETTFCNLYTRDGYSLTNAVLGGVSEEDNLLTVLDGLDYDEGYSAQKVRDDFAQGLAGEVSFTYQGVRETLSYVPVEGTDWLLTYLIRESVISDRIRSVSEGIILRSVVQSLLTVAALLAMFLFIIRQNRKNAHLLLEKETQEAEERGKREELEQRLRLQEEILEKERQQNEQSEMITALSSDYRAVYFLELDEDAGVCYQAHTDLDTGLSAGERFPYWKTVTAYAESYVTDAYREEFLRFVRPEAIRAGLREAHVISYRYMVRRHGHESYEMVRFAGVHRPGEAEDDVIRRVGACFTDVDAETRQTM